jgi:hypothetical protein
MQDIWFLDPLHLKLDASHERTIRSAWEGLEFLGELPVRRGKQYRAAVRACRDVLDGLGSTGKARRALKGAAREAAIKLD